MPINKKNILIPTAVAGLCWLGVAVVILTLRPEGTATLTFFFALCFFAVYLSIAVVYTHKRRGILAASAFLSFLLLRFFQLDTLINSILLLSLFITIEAYFWKK